MYIWLIHVDGNNRNNTYYFGYVILLCYNKCNYYKIYVFLCICITYTYFYICICKLYKNI